MMVMMLMLMMIMLLLMLMLTIINMWIQFDDKLVNDIGLFGVG